jgi:sarcosine oxidase subunit alpha
VTGPDAGEFLDRVYTNRLSTLRVGRLRYTMMCGLDGMVLDDGTVCRVGPEHFRVTTTTGGAAAVLEWLERWLQTEWPDLRVHLTSTTDHWATIAVVGPRAREVLGPLAPGTDLSAAAFPFLTWQDADVADTPATLCRVSFSGELAFEVYVRWWEAEAVWDAIVEAGRPAGITPYGTETMHVLRAEKGFVIVGQDTDGTVTPQDLGYGWIVSSAKGDFVGRRSHARSDTTRPDRKHLVGLLTEDGETVLPEGAAVVPVAELPPPPVPILGHVTSSYDSAALGRPIALGLVRSGRERTDELLYAVVDGRTVPTRVVDPVFYDPEGERRDG